jgi:hypothetical protein
MLAGTMAAKTKTVKGPLEAPAGKDLTVREEYARQTACPRCRALQGFTCRNAKARPCDAHGARLQLAIKEAKPQKVRPEPHAQRAGDKTVGIALTSYTLAQRFKKLVRAAERSGFAVIVDADAIAIKLVPKEIVDAGMDLRDLHVDSIRVHNGCGGGSSRFDQSTQTGT